MVQKCYALNHAEVFWPNMTEGPHIADPDDGSDKDSRGNYLYSVQARRAMRAYETNTPFEVLVNK